MSSEYELITKELRSSCGSPYDMEAFVAIDSHDFDNLCDNIDAIHSSLERENKRLREELDRAISEQDTKDMCDFVDQLHMAAGKREDVTLWDVDYIALPVDADGVIIRVGDELYANGVSYGIVNALMFDKKWWISFGIGWIPFDFHKFHHGKLETWENIISDAVKLGFTDPDNEHLADKLVERCKALAGETE